MIREGKKASHEIKNMKRRLLPRIPVNSYTTPSI